MNVLTSDTVAVPDSSFPFSSELEGLLEPQPSPEECVAAMGVKLASWQGDSNFFLPPYCPGMYSIAYMMVDGMFSSLSPISPSRILWTGC